MFIKMNDFEYYTNMVDPMPLSEGQCRMTV